MADAGTPPDDLNATTETVPSEVQRNPEPPVLTDIPQYTEEDVRQLGWQPRDLTAVTDTLISALTESLPPLAHTVQTNVLQAVRRDLDRAPRPAFDMNGFFEHLDHNPRALDMIRLMVAPPPLAPVSTELHALLDRAPTGLAAYLLFLKEAKDLKLSLTDRAALFSKTLSLVEQAHRRTNLSELQVYHAQLAAAYTDPVALACLNEPSLDHNHRSVTAVEVLTWIKAYKDARPRSKGPKNAGGGHTGRRPRPRRTGAPPAKPADKPKTGTSSVKKPAAGK